MQHTEHGNGQIPRSIERISSFRHVMRRIRYTLNLSCLH